MSNPWEEISLDDYENHMRLASVNQLQTMNAIMKEQFESYQVETAMVLGIAGGNGLEHVRPDKYRVVYGIDINADYLREIPGRYPQLSDVLQCMHLDIVNEAERLPHAELVIANLLIEYIGYTAFQKAIKQVSPKFISCVIQINTDENKWVSDSPYLHAFDGLDEIHHQMEQGKLTDTMKEIGYSFILKEERDLPNGKALVRLDYRIIEEKEMFESDYAKTEYIEKDNVVFHVWKKEAHFDDYRKPVEASLQMLKEHENSIFIVDARKGFEDVKEDVEWGFAYFLPELKKTGCEVWGFILPEVSDIEGEIDLWTREIEKNFRVIRATSYESVLNLV